MKLEASKINNPRGKPRGIKTQQQMSKTTLTLALCVLFQLSLPAQSNSFSVFEQEQLVSSGTSVTIGKPLSAFEIEQVTRINPNLVTVNTNGFSAFDIQQFISAGAEFLIKQYND